MQRAIKLNQEVCIKPYINMNTQLRKNAKTDFKKYLSSWWIMYFFEKTIENVRKHRDITIAAAEARKNYLESKTNYHNTNFISENLLEMKMKRT